jgi:hypothetical protein
MRGVKSEVQVKAGGMRKRAKRIPCFVLRDGGTGRNSKISLAAFISNFSPLTSPRRLHD